MASIASESEQSSQHGSFESQNGEGNVSYAEDSVSEVIMVGRSTTSDRARSRSSSGLFVSEDSGEEQTATPDVIAVRLPKVRQRWQYEEFPEENSIQSIVRELGTVKGEVRYGVRFQDGHEESVLLRHLQNLTNGSTALDTFVKMKSQEEDQDEERSESDALEARRFTRPTRSKQISTPDFVDSAQLDLSNEDELISRNTRNLRSRQSTLKFGLSSAPKPSQSFNSQEAHSESSSSLSKSGLNSSKISNLSVSKRKKQPRRATRSTGSLDHQRLSYKHDDAVEVIEDDDDSEDAIPSLFTKKRKRSGKTRARVVLRGLQMESPVAPSRRSGRSGKTTKNMEERGEDDIFAASEDDRAPVVPKAIGAREIFKTLPYSNDFRRRHCQHCDSCGEHGNSNSSTGKGQLIYCQGCTLSYHRNCLGPRSLRDHLVTKVGNGDFVLQCRRCVGVVRKRDRLAPRQDTCQVCQHAGSACTPLSVKKTSKQEQKEREDNGGEDPITVVDSNSINNTDNVLFRCMSCWCAFHFSHLPAREDGDHMKIDENVSIADQRYIQYCKDWTCKDCVNVPAKLSALVAWRPMKQETYVPGTTWDMVNEDQKEYLVKWSNLSYFRTMWMPGAWVWGVTNAAMRNAFGKRNNGHNLPIMRVEDAIPEEFLRVDIVLDVRYTSLVTICTEEVDKARIKEIDQALVKYKGLGYEDATWENAPSPEDGDRWTDFVIAYDNWVMGRYVHLPRQPELKKRLSRVRDMDFGTKLRKLIQPTNLEGGKMMGYQMEGLNWLYYHWHQAKNAILADEMGLGKTIQIIGLLATLIQDHHCWPFLVVVPNSTCPNWRREIKTWAPSLRVVSYFGSSAARTAAYAYELFPDSSKELKCHIVVTSYEAAADEDSRRFFKSVPWQGLIVDEGQRLKNDKTQLYRALTVLNASFKILLTGTPLQNNMRELFNLLQFLDSSFEASQLEEKFADLTNDNVAELRSLIEPYFLRRTKAQVLTFLPPMAQIIVPVTMSIVQKKLYKSILAKNPELIKCLFNQQSLNKNERHNLNNILMQLRKCLCHPFIYSDAIEERSSNAAISHRNLVEASSKLQLLEVMLPKLQERGHRVLIFSQFLEMLTVVEDFLDGLGLPFLRLDGSVGTLEKQKRIDQFNAPDSSYFAFLLSTRAGGVGINLASADTVIIMDPDFNPHQDIQALSRAHRIGQKNKVLVFQLMTRDSAEEKMVQIGRKKLALHVLIEQMDNDDDAVLDMESVIRHGAAALFDDDNERDIHYDSASVDKLLDRSQVENTEAGDDKAAETTFSKARIWANDKAALEEDLEESEADQKAPDPTMWDKILKDRERTAAKEAAARSQILGRGKRARQVVDYSKANYADLGQSPSKKAELSDSDTDFQAKPADSDAEDDEGDEGEAVTVGELKSPPKPKKSRSKIASEASLDNKVNDVFRRAKVPPRRSNTPPRSHINIPTNGTAHDRNDQSPTPCAACRTYHERGRCLLKLSGVEKCGLCGLAHYGVARTCPHFNSETQVNAMIMALKQSVEPKELKEIAMKYLRGLKSSLVQTKKRAAEKEAARNGVPIGTANSTSNTFLGGKPKAWMASATDTPDLSSTPASGQVPVHGYDGGSTTEQLGDEERSAM